MSDLNDPDEERLRRVLNTGPVQPLAPDTGNFDKIVARARHRKQRRVGAVLGAFVLVAAVGVGLGVLTKGGTDSLSEQPAGPQSTAGATTSPSPSPSPSVGGSSSPSAAPSVGSSGSTGSGTSGLPAGGPVPSGFTARSVTSVGGGVSYVLGDAPCTSAPCTSMVRTTDGGKSFVGVRPPRAALSSPAGAGADSSSVTDVRFADARDGWVFGGALYATHDGGASWSRVSLRSGGVVTALATDGSNVYAVVATCTSSGRSCSSPAMYSAAVGSNAWRPVAGVSVGGSTGTGSISLGASGSALLGDQVFVRSGSGWRKAASVPCAVGGPTAAVAPASGSSVFAFCGEGAAGSVYVTIYVTTDAGGSWRKVTGKDSDALRLVSGSSTFAGSSAQVLLAGSNNPTNGGSLQVSRNGGATWSSAGLPDRGWLYVGAGGGGRLDAISASGTLYVSTDNGSSWGTVTF